MKLTILMTEENIYGRGLVERLLEEQFKIEAIVVEKGSSLAEKTKSFLRNDFHNPPPLSKIINGKEIAVYYTENHNSNYCFDKLKLLSSDLILLGGTRILEQKIIDVAKIGILNCHPGLLPEYRGMDVVGWAIYNGDDIGVTCHFINDGVDTGDILMRKKAEWGYEGDTLLKIRIRLQKFCIETMIECVKRLKKGDIIAMPQQGKGMRYREMPLDIAKEVERRLKPL